MKVTVTSTKAFQNTKKKLTRAMQADLYSILKRYGEAGVSALADATPKDTGNTASQWRYEIRKTGRGSASLVFCNDHVNKGANIAILLQYGHGTGTGGYVAGTDYINPALKPIFEQIKEEAAKALGGD